MYNYKNAVTNDIVTYYKDDILEIINAQDMDQKEELKQELYDRLFVADGVTGNGSGSYTFSTYKAMQYVTSETDEPMIYNNLELLDEILKDYGYTELLFTDLLSNGWEWMDVTIRCGILSECIEYAIQQITEDLQVNKSVDVVVIEG